MRYPNYLLDRLLEQLWWPACMAGYGAGAALALAWGGNAAMWALAFLGAIAAVVLVTFDRRVAGRLDRTLVAVVGAALVGLGPFPSTKPAVVAVALAGAVIAVVLRRRRETPRGSAPPS